jgi:hypothetical protein
MKRYSWGQLNPRQLGRFAEYFVKMEFAMQGFDIYTPEVDDKGIDFIVKKESDRYWEVQVKSVHRSNYIFFPKSKFKPERNNLFAAVVVFTSSEPPSLYLLSAALWRTPNSLLVDRKYVGKKSAPEWGLQLSKKNESLLSEYAFDKVVGTL